MIKRFIIAFILLVLVVGGIVGFNLFRDNAIKQFFANMPVPTLTVSTIDVKPMDWTPGIEALGTVSASHGVNLAVETAGIVKEILFEANDRVKKGQLLVHLDDEVELADLAAAKTKVVLDKQALDRAVALQKRGVGTDATLDTAQATYSSSVSQVAKLQALADQKLVQAPFDGTVGIPRIDLGQYVAPGNAIVTLQNLDKLRVDFTVPEQHFAELKIGQQAIFGVSKDDMPYKGTITGIDPKIDPVSRLVSVRAEINNPDGHLSPGQFVQVRVQLPEEKGVIAIPQTALINSLYGDYVYAVRPAQEANAKAADTKPEEAKAEADRAKAPAEGTAKPDDKAAAKPEAEKLAAYQIFVTPGRRFGGVVEITKGVKAGEEIVTAGQNRLSNGAPVNVDNTVDISKLPATQGAAQ
ncbi:efflux RND transporter periplasmic adaptor subunit [Manganibacter manganicus]|uniref:Efflux transporter periplasmic adaptor subunit n=1 Tax=Manganibacter manganicus TaxID=1873176 RepID=A0A1V8RKT4_9HYPH|nr:efflux RND transporter periplasmic adaptor subunit [Pseudaminobacter manganicus]OQM73703.1 efflux transporter periplasmic adaptor subunit [Pseudaminobacter manganicus]